MDLKVGGPIIMSSQVRQALAKEVDDRLKKDLGHFTQDGSFGQVSNRGLPLSKNATLQNFRRKNASVGT